MHTSTDWDWLEHELDALLALDLAARIVRLDALAVEHPRLAARLRAWLAGIDASGDFLEPGVSSTTPGTRLGPWRLVARAGEGGMGEVWRAERADGAFERQVAIKFLRADRRQHAASLKRERELLARLRHPGIAQLLDAGIADDGRPFLVTEWIDGMSLADWVAQGADLRARVRLVVQLAEALAFAHANLVVHRDLKPANVLVAADGTPRLLDFGIARLLDAQRGDALTEDRAMTPAFASPEQVLGHAATTRTDVHGLGCLLFWLLAGRAPFQLGHASLAEVVQVITQQDVPRLSALVAVPPDLEAIAAKALARAPEARYPSAAALAEDLGRWLAGENVLARPPSRIVSARRWLRRHWLPAGLTAGIVLAAVAGAVVNQRSAQAARIAAEIAERERARAEAESRAGAAELARTEDFISLVASTFRSIEDERLSADDWMNRLRKGIATFGPADSRARAHLVVKVAELEQDRGHTQRAGTLLASLAGDPAVRADDELAARVACGRANAATFAGDHEQAAGWLREGVARAERLQGAARSALVHCLMMYANLAVRAGVQPEHRQALERALDEVGRMPPREARWRRASLEYNLGMLDDIEGRFDDALRHYREAVRLDRELGHERRAGAAGTQATIAGILMLQGKLAEAEAAYAEALPAIEQSLGRSQTLATELANLAGLDNRLGRHERALAGAGRALEVLDAVNPGDDRTRANALSERGKAALALGQFDAARADFANAARAFERSVGAGHPLVLALGVPDARARLGAGDLAGAAAQLDSLLAQLEAAGSVGGQVAALLARAAVHRAAGEPESAEALFARARVLERSRSGEGALPVVLVDLERARALVADGRDDEARALFTRILPALEQAYGPGHGIVADARRRVFPQDKRGRGD